MATNTRDPRSIITPEAFGIDRSLLGTPLARPGQRLVALVIDLVVIGILTAFTSGLSVFIWGLVGLFLVRMAFKRPNVELGQVTSMLYRSSIGCLGVLILLVVLAVGLTRSLMQDAVETADGVGEGVPGEIRQGFLSGLEGVASGLGASQGLRRAGTPEEGEAAALEVLDAFDNLTSTVELDRSTAEDRVQVLEDLLVSAMGEDPAFTDDPEDFARRMAVRWEEARAAAAVPEGDAEVDSARGGAEAGERARARVADLSLEEAVREYQALREDGGEPGSDLVLAALRERVVSELAADTVAALSDALEDQERQRVSAEGRLADARAELAEESSGIVALLRDIWDQAGSAVGLWSLYFTVTLTLFKGYTVGKRIMGIRVLRLDGQPIGWWSAFERAGGYVAGIATGLLGFLQVYWDPNRQCVHDKIGGTVVVQAGQGPIAGAVEAAWGPGSEGSDTGGTGGSAANPGGHRPGPRGGGDGPRRPDARGR